MNVIYDLARMPTTYDFVPWACFARTCGAESVHFCIDGEIAHHKYPRETAWKRFATILLPVCKLAGLSWTIGAKAEGREFPYLAGNMNTLYKETGKIEKLKATQRVDKEGYVTITLRESFRNRYRNSNVPEWEKFKSYLEDRKIDYLVFPECENEPIDLETRMAYYTHADMNLGVATGPMALCIFSEAPYLSLNQTPEPKGDEKLQYDQVKLLEAQDFPPGSQFAWKNERQLLVYEPDTFENIVSAFERMERVKQKEAA